MDIHNTTRWVICKNVFWESTDSGLVLLDYSRDMYFEMDRYAACVWLAIQWTPEGITVREIVDLLGQALDLGRARLEIEACRCVDALVQNVFVRASLDGELNNNQQVSGDGFPLLRKKLKSGVDELSFGLHMSCLLQPVFQN